MSKFPENVNKILHSEEFKKCLKNRNIEDLYYYISYNIDYDSWIPIITNILYSSGIDPLLHQKSIPMKFFTYNTYDYIIDFIIPAGIKEIKYRAFAYSYLKKIKLPNSLETIGEEAFKGCFDLTSIKFPESLRIIGKDAFENCNNLKKKIIIPKNVTYIHPQSFPRKIIKFEGTTGKFESICPIDLIYRLESTFTRVECKNGILIPIQDKYNIKFEKY